MKVIKKLFISIIGATLVLLGLLFIVLPGPALLLIIPGLFMLSFEYPLAKTWLRKCMIWARKTAQWIDRKLLHRKYS
jgi:hypothetical protein